MLDVVQSKKKIKVGERHAMGVKTAGGTCAALNAELGLDIVCCSFCIKHPLGYKDTTKQFAKHHVQWIGLHPGIGNYACCCVHQNAIREVAMYGVEGFKDRLNQWKNKPFDPEAVLVGLTSPQNWLEANPMQASRWMESLHPAKAMGQFKWVHYSAAYDETLQTALSTEHRAYTVEFALGGTPYSYCANPACSECGPSTMLYWTSYGFWQAINEYSWWDSVFSLSMVATHSLKPYEEDAYLPGCKAFELQVKNRFYLPLWTRKLDICLSSRITTAVYESSNSTTMVFYFGTDAQEAKRIKSTLNQFWTSQQKLVTPCL